MPSAVHVVLSLVVPLWSAGAPGAAGAAEVAATARGPASAGAPADTVPIREWPVPWERTRPRDPYVGPEGRVWFVGQRGNYLAYLESPPAASSRASTSRRARPPTT